MPLHDWTRVETYLYHDFHTGWLVSIRRVLNAGVLPAGYYALAEQSTRTMGPDVLALELPGRPEERGQAVPSSAGFRHKRLAIRHKSNDRLVAIVELVSPGNKAATHPFRSFVNKVVRAVEAGIHVLVIDPFPPGKRDPNGIHGAIWEELGGEPYPADKPLAIAAYEANPSGPACYVEPLAAGDVLPDSPLFLEPGYYVPVPLERSYQVAYEDVLPQHRKFLEQL